MSHVEALSQEADKLSLRILLYNFYTLCLYVFINKFKIEIVIRVVYYWSN